MYRMPVCRCHMASLSMPHVDSLSMPHGQFAHACADNLGCPQPRHVDTTPFIKDRDVWGQNVKLMQKKHLVGHVPSTVVRPSHEGASAVLVARCRQPRVSPTLLCRCDSCFKRRRCVRSKREINAKKTPWSVMYRRPLSDPPMRAPLQFWWLVADNPGCPQPCHVDATPFTKDRDVWGQNVKLMQKKHLVGHVPSTVVRPSHEGAIAVLMARCRQPRVSPTPPCRCDSCFKRRRCVRSKCEINAKKTPWSVTCEGPPWKDVVRCVWKARWKKFLRGGNFFYFSPPETKRPNELQYNTGYCNECTNANANMPTCHIRV